MREFLLEYAGKMNFYLSAGDDLVRHPDDAPGIGIILSKTRDQVTVEYALRNTATPILPENLAASLPTVQQPESELRQHGGEGTLP